MSTNNALTLVVDFDRTVFDSDALYQDLYSLCEARGIPQGRLDHSLGLVPPDNLLFNFFLMVERSLIVEGLQLVKLIAELQDFVHNEGRKYVFPDVGSFLDAARKAGCKIAILIYGDIAFQLAKFVGSGLSLLCHSFTATEHFKWQQLEMFGSSPFVFLDDNPRDMTALRAAFQQ